MNRWLEAMGTAWRRLDPIAVAQLFTEGAMYRPHPHRPPLHGRRAIAQYWADEFATIESAEVSWGEPIIDGRRMAVEYQATTSAEASQTLDSGVLLLQFEAGLCSELREYWMLQELKAA